MTKRKHKSLCLNDEEIEFVLKGFHKDSPNPRLVRFVEAYLLMAGLADYRPQAPGDGLGSVYLSKEEVADRERLREEAKVYAMHFSDEEDTHKFQIGCTNFTSNRAFVWTIEAARAMCGGNNGLAIDLLEMAIKEIKRQHAVTKTPMSFRDYLIDNRPKLKAV